VINDFFPSIILSNCSVSLSARSHRRGPAMTRMRSINNGNLAWLTLERGADIKALSEIAGSKPETIMR